VDTKLTVAYVTRTLPAYRHPIMDALASRDISLSVIVAGRDDDPVAPVSPAPGRNWQYVRAPGRSARWRADIIAKLASIGPDVILLEHGARLDFVWTVLAARGPRAPRVLWTHGIERHERFTGETSIASLGRWCQLRLAEGIVCYDEETAEALRGRLKGKVIGSAKNTINRSEFSIERTALERIGRGAHQASLALPSRRYVIALGRLIEEKEFHRVPNVVRIARMEGFDVGAIFIGDGPERERIATACGAAGLQLGRDAFMPGEFTEPRQLMRWLYAADVCVNPGCLGLSVVDCAYAGLPVVSVMPGRKGPYHGPEWKYVIDDKTGWFARTNTDEAIAAIASGYLSRSDQERSSIEKACLAHAAANLGVDEMVDGILRTCREVRAANMTHP
jgi:glycosyltransferase involved in cell wall biosynthesis